MLLIQENHHYTPLHCYIGHTRTMLARRLAMHVQGGRIKEHLSSHQIHINRGLLDDNTEILRTERCPSRLTLYDALFISREKPRINMQKDFTDKCKSFINAFITICIASEALFVNHLYQSPLALFTLELRDIRNSLKLNQF